MRLLILIVAFAFATAAAAADTTPVWIIDKADSKLGFTGSMNGQTFNGEFSRWDAQIAFDPDNLAGSHVLATIDTSSVETDDEARDEALPSSDWFSVTSFPKAAFVSRRISATGTGHFVADGDLTIRGVTHPVSLPFDLVITGDTAKMSGSVSIDRTTFGVGQGQWKTADAVALEVTIKVQIAARRKP